MRSILIAFSAIALLYSCSYDSKPASVESTGNPEMEKRIAQLERENAQKDSLINESLEFFSEIQSNLESIEIKKEELKLIADNPEISKDEKEWILEQIRHINFLREENAKKVVRLNNQLKESGLKIKELENMVQDLIKSIQAKDEQINELQAEMGSLDKAYSKLFDAYKEKGWRGADLTDVLYTVYYYYGTEEELVKNQVIVRKNGFIGIGKKIKLMDNFNEKYFAKIDLTEEKEIFIEGVELKFVTDHPSNSYELIPQGKNTKIRITNPREFWKISKYMVVIVE